MPWTIDCGCTTTSMRSYGEAEQEVRLDHLEALVHQRRRVDRDLRAHVPRRVRERVGRADVAQVVGGAPAERAAGRGQHQRDASRRRGRRQCTAAAPSARSRRAAARRPERARLGQHERPAGDQALLVGERQVGAGAQRRQRWRRARPRRRWRSGRRRRRTPRRAGRWRRGRRPRRGRAVDAVLGGRRAQCVGVAAAGEGDHLELRVSGTDSERLGSNRTGGAEDRDPFHRVERYPAPPAAVNCSAGASRGGSRIRGGSRRRDGGEDRQEHEEDECNDGNDICIFLSDWVLCIIVDHDR